MGKGMPGEGGKGVKVEGEGEGEGEAGGRGRKEERRAGGRGGSNRVSILPSLPPSRSARRSGRKEVFCANGVQERAVQAPNVLYCVPLPPALESSRR